MQVWFFFFFFCFLFLFVLFFSLFFFFNQAFPQLINHLFKSNWHWKLISKEDNKKYNTRHEKYPNSRLNIFHTKAIKMWWCVDQTIYLCICLGNVICETSSCPCIKSPFYTTAVSSKRKARGDRKGKNSQRIIQPSDDANKL